METHQHLAPWLSDDVIGMRAPGVDDAASAAAWYIGDGPHDTASVERELTRRESIPWGGNPVITLVVARVDSGRIAGGVVATRSPRGTCALEVTVAEPEDRGDILRRVLVLVVPWLLDEVGVRTVTIDTPGDDAAMLAAAEAAGMIEAVRRREHLLRPGGRVDMLQLERVNREWGRHAG